MKCPSRTSKVGVIYKNVIVLGFGFMLHFTAFGGTSALQSSMNPAGLGTASLATLYAAMMLGNLFLPSVVIRWLGCKWTIVLSAVTYMPYIAAQFYPSYETLIPAAVIIGLGASTLWVGQSVYIMEMADKYKLVTGTTGDVASSRFFGITSTLFAASSIWGNLVSSTVFSADDKLVNTTNTEFNSNCGPQYIPKHEFENNNRINLPSIEKIYTVLGIYLLCMVMACVSLSAGLPSVTRSNKVERENSVAQLLFSTVKALKDPKVYLLMPISFLTGLVMAFNSADYNQAFITCVLGVQYIGFISIIEGICNALSALATGLLVKYIGRLTIVITITVLQLALYTFLLIWRPVSEDITPYFIVAAVIGICGGFWGVHIRALGGRASSGQKEAFYSNYGLAESLGFIVGYSYSYYLATWVKIIIVIVSLVIGTIGFIAVELMTRKTPTIYNVQQ